MKNLWKNKELNKHTWTDLLAAGLIVGACIVVMGVSLFSEFGMHPDEWDVKVCLEWGTTHWIWPDMRAKGLGDTYSWYGYTKVCNYTPYFLVAGKIAGVFKWILGLFTNGGVWPYYRVPNLLLMIGMTAFIIRKFLKERSFYLLIAFGISVQAWYIFSYVTADARDFVWAFVSIWLLADKDSLLWRNLQNKEQADGSLSLPTRDLVGCIVLGLIYGMMLLGKPYYYANMVMTFIVLLLYLIKTLDKSERRLLWKKYLIIVGVCVAVFAARFGLDIYYYGGDKAEVKQQMAEMYASDDKKPSTPVEEQCQTYHMAEKGYKLTDLFTLDEGWAERSFKSFVSARTIIQGDNWYFIIMGVIYAAIYIWIGVACFSGHKIVFIAGTILNIGGVIASILNSYLIDAQAQGRYLLPILLTTAYMASLVPKLWDNKLFRGVVLLASFLSLMYFGLFDARKLIDMAYVRSII